MAKTKTVAQLKKKLWPIFSKYIRLRDALKTTGYVAEANCITCYKRYPVTAMDAGHFLSRRHTAILFDETNVHAQCVRCNYSGGEQYLYSRRLEELYGATAVTRLMSLRETTKKYTRPELEALISFYTTKVKEIITRHGSPWK